MSPHAAESQCPLSTAFATVAGAGPRQPRHLLCQIPALGYRNSGTVTITMPASLPTACSPSSSSPPAHAHFPGPEDSSLLSHAKAQEGSQGPSQQSPAQRGALGELLPAFLSFPFFLSPYHPPAPFSSLSLPRGAFCAPAPAHSLLGHIHLLPETLPLSLAPAQRAPQSWLSLGVLSSV